MNSASPTWLASAGGSANVLQQIEREVQGLSESYLRCLFAGNGGEVGLRASPFNLCLDSAESALEYWRSGTYPKHGVFIFGGDGGGILQAFDLGVASAAGMPAQCTWSAIGQWLLVRACGVAHNADSYARLAAEHSPITSDRRVLWVAVQSNKVYLTL